jgi:hypothetical protein
MSERWKNIAGYEGLYQVSDWGRVKSLISNKWTRRDLILSLRIVGGNRIYYLGVVLYKNKIKKAFKVHRLVGLHFVKNSSSLPLINHLDEDTFNNYYKNLVWCNERENICYSRKNCTSESVGVYLHKGKWRAQITVGGKRRSLGAFTSEALASEAYKNALNSNGLLNRYAV